jgi:excisionase family DNA binding protein
MIGRNRVARGVRRATGGRQTETGDRPEARTAGGPSRAYSAAEAAALLGVSHDTLTKHYRSVHGYRLGTRVLFPRWAVDRLITDPEAGGRDEGAEQTPAVDRVLALLPLLKVDDLRTVTRAILAREVA